MAGRRARTGRGWDAAPARPRQPRSTAQAGAVGRAEEPTDPGERAREICLRLLAVRPRTRTELAAALKQRGIAEAVAAEVLARYGEVGIIDDTAFARAWVSSRHHGRGLARRALAAELRQKGVDSETVGLALDELDPDTEATTARALVDRLLRTERGGTAEALLRRLVGMLARKGYPPGLAIRVVRDALAEWPGGGGPVTGADSETTREVDLDLVAEALESAASVEQFAEVSDDSRTVQGLPGASNTAGQKPRS